MHKFYVSGNQKLTPSTLLLTLKKDPKSKPFSFQPGQYTSISFKRKGRPTPTRCFSIVNSPTDQNLLQCSIRMKGNFTNSLTDLNEGDEVKVRGSFGGFVFDAKRDVNTVLLAGGIGIAPFMSMIQYAAATHLSNNITLIYSCSHQSDVPFLEQLIDLEKSNPNFKIIFVIGKGPTDRLAGQNVKTGRITPEIIENAINGEYDKDSFFICGPPLFMHTMAKDLQHKGVPADKIMTEAFSQGHKRQTGKICSWPLNIYALSAIGVVAASVAVLVSDLLTALPASSLFGPSSSLTDSSEPANGRQNELDKLVNGLNGVNGNAPASDAVVKAAQQSTTANTPTPATTTTVTLPKYIPPAAPAPVPKPAPVCTTDQSGVKTCV